MSDNSNRIWAVVRGLLIVLIISLFVVHLLLLKTDGKKVSNRLSENWSKLELVLSQIEQNYVDSLDYDAITEQLLPVLMKQLDPHSIYLPPAQLKEANEELDSNFEGIGITFNIPQDTAIVISVIPSGPSSRAGLVPGDKIITIDSDTVAGVQIPQDSLVRRMRGKKGTTVEIGIMRDNEMVDFTIERDKIPVNSVEVAYMINDTTGYIKLAKFSRTSYKEVLVSMLDLSVKGMKRLIFDLQGNTGGYLDQALLILNEFLPKGTMLVYMEGLHRNRSEFKADGSGHFQDLELIVLIDQNSASSSEIVAGALQDNDRATIIGRRSYGKGIVQEPVYFSDNSGIRLTVARFHTATGRCIQKPYHAGDDAYAYDIYERYRHGEMTQADSIRKNDSLRFETPGGRVVYGGGGIIPDIFVPIDTTGVTDLLVKINRQALSIKFSSQMAQRYRKELRTVETIDELDSLLDSMNLEKTFIRYVRASGIPFSYSQWKISGEIVMTQIRALIGRYSPIEDLAFYPRLNTLDNMIKTALEYRSDAAASLPQ